VIRRRLAEEAHRGLLFAEGGADGGTPTTTEWVLAGHGRRWRAPSRDAMRAEVRALAERMARTARRSS
jgi:hypothetical protein